MHIFIAFEILQFQKYIKNKDELILLHDNDVDVKVRDICFTKCNFSYPVQDVYLQLASSSSGIYGEDYVKAKLKPHIPIKHTA